MTSNLFHKSGDVKICKANEAAQSERETTSSNQKEGLFMNQLHWPLI